MKQTFLNQRISLYGRLKIEEQINMSAETDDTLLLMDKNLTILINGKRIIESKELVENHISIKKLGSSMN